MLIDKIDDEFRELNEIVEKKVAKTLFDIVRDGKIIKSEDLLGWSQSIRELSKSQALVENKKFKAEIVKSYARKYVKDVQDLFSSYDNLATLYRMNRDVNGGHIAEWCERWYYSISSLVMTIEKINMSNELISEITMETWEPLPNDEKEDNVENIVISSETRSMSLNNVASDVGNLNNFFECICRLVNPEKNQRNNIYLRRVETGSLVVAVSCAMQIAPMIAFIFWCVKLYQKAEKRYLDNADNKLKVINDSLDIAKEILKIDPNNKEADEIIQKCGVSVLNFLENNPTGTINGEHYDIGMEKPKIEDKENK